MDLEVIKYFKDAVQLGSIAQSAKANFISQPAVSMAIKKLEREMGGKLFLRNTSGLEITSLGEKLLVLADELDSVMTKIKKISNGVTRLTPSQIQVGAIYSLGLFAINNLSLAFMKKYPHLSLNIHFLTNSQGLKALQKGDLDVFFAVNQKTDKSLRRTVCGKEPLVAIYPYLRQPSDPMQKISLHEFANEPFIAFGKELPTQQLIEAVFKKSQLKLKTTHRFDNVELIKRAVQAGLGCAIVPFSTVKQEALENKLTVKKLNSSELSREAIAITRKEQNPQSNLQTLINFAQRYLFENNSPAPKF